MLPVSLRQFIQNLPKAHIHLHLEGSVFPAHAAQLAKQAGVTIPGLVQDATAPGGYRYQIADFSAFLTLYEALSKCLVNKTAVLQMIDGVARHLVDDNVHYAEITFTTETIIRNGMPEEELLEALEEGRTAARTAHGVEIRWVFDFVRSIPDEAMPTVERALKARARGMGVVALGVGGPEGVQYPARTFMQAFERARAEDLPAVPHAGEQVGPWAVWEALFALNALRIGHGFRSIEDPCLLQWLKDTGTCLEICPTSNIKLVHVPSFAAHPVNRLIEAGLTVTLAADDPGLLDTTLCHEYAGCADAFGWDAQRILTLAQNGVRRSLAPPEIKTALLAAQQQVFDAYQKASHPAATA